MVATRKMWLLSASILLLIPMSIAPAAATKAQKTMVRDFVRGKIPASQEAKTAVAAVIRDEIAGMAKKAPIAPKDAVAVSKARVAFMNVYLQSAPQDANAIAARKEVIATTLGLCKILIEHKDYPAVVKVNCTVILAELDERLSPQGRPIPAQSALGPLFKYATGESHPTYVRAIALYGLERHLGERWSSFNESAQNTLTTGLIKIANSEPSGFMNIKDNAWLVRRAYDCLGTVHSDTAKDKAIERLADPKTLPSLRLSAANYLAKIDISKFTPEQMREYFYGLTNLTRNQLFDWYYLEQDRLQIAAGGGQAGMGGYGGGGSGMGGYGGGGSGMGGYGGGGGGSGMGGYGGEGGMGGYGGGEGGMGGYGSAGRGAREKPIDTQTWQTLAARRRVNHITQIVHTALDGKPLSEEEQSPMSVLALTDAQMPEELQGSVSDLIEALDEVQDKLNTATAVTDIKSLLSQVREPIIDVMHMANQIPGFLERYPEIAADEGLAVTPVTPKAPAGDGDANADGDSDDDSLDPGAPNAGDASGDN